MEVTDVLAPLGAALLGIVIGAIINALSDDLPLRNRPQLPHYPNGVPRPLLAWSGLLAYLTGLHEGPSVQLSEEEEKSRGLSLGDIASLAYDTRLSWRYPLVEIGMAALLAFVVIYPFEEPRIGVWFVFLSILMLITVIDLEHRLILFVVIIPSVLVTLILNAAFPEMTDEGQRPFIGIYLWRVDGWWPVLYHVPGRGRLCAAAGDDAWSCRCRRSPSALAM